MNDRIEVTKFMNDTLRLSDDQCVDVCDRLADILADGGCFCEGGVRSVTWLCDSCFEAVKTAPGEIFFNDETLGELGLGASSVDTNDTISLYVVNPEKFTTWAKAYLNGQNV